MLRDGGWKRWLAGPAPVFLWFSLFLPARPVIGAARHEAPTAPRALRVLWVDSDGNCPVDVKAVAREARRILKPMNVDVDWMEVSTLQRVAMPNDVLVVTLSRDPAGRKDPPMGATLRNGAQVGVWVLCPAVAEVLGGARDCRDGCASKISTAVGRVVAHELVHVVAPEAPHASWGLMATRLDAVALTQPVLLVDPNTQRAVRARLGLRHVGSVPE
jgi:hypothetical protein